MKINQFKKVQVDARILKVHMKVRDEFSAALIDSEGNELRDYEGYVPGFMPGDHHGDYVILDIDIDNGVILNWKTPSQDEIEAFIKSDEENE